MKKKGFDFLMGAQLTIERAVFAFMLQLSFIKTFHFTPAAVAIVKTSTLKVLFQVEMY